MTRKERRGRDIREQWKSPNIHNTRRERRENKSNNIENEVRRQPGGKGGGWRVSVCLGGGMAKRLRGDA